MAKRKKKAVTPKVSKKKKSDIPQEDDSKPVSTDRPPSSAKKMAATSSTSPMEDELVQVPCFNTVTLGNSTKTDSGDVSHFWCKYCEFSAGSMQELVPHMGQHIIKCSYCSFNSFSRSEVAKHCKSEHDKDLKHTPQEVELSSGDYDMDKDPCSACMFCDFMTYSTMHLEMHTATKHPGMHAKSVAKMITKQASAQVRKDDANFYQTMPNNIPECEKESKVAEIIIDPEDVGSPKDIKCELSLGLLDIKPKQAVLQENLTKESFLGKSVGPNSLHGGEKSSQKSSKDWAVKVEIMYCLSCPYSNAYIEKLKCHSLVQHPVGAGAVTFNALGELANAEDITFFCVREDCTFSSGDCLSYQRHLMGCCSLHSSMSVLEKERLTSTISYILSYLKKFGIKEEKGFTEFASVFGVVPISFQTKQSCPATSDSQNFLQPAHSSEHVYKYADQHKVSNQKLSGIEHSDSVLTSARPNSNNCQTALRDNWKYVQLNSAPQSSSHVDVVSTSTLPSNNQQISESHPQQQPPQYPLQQLISQSPYAPSNSVYNQPERLATSGSINPFPSDQRYNINVTTFQKPTQNYSSNTPLDPRVLNRELPPSEPEPNRNSFEPQLLTQAGQNLTHNDSLLSLHNFNPNSNAVQEFPTSMNYQQNVLQNNNSEISYGQVIHSNLSSVTVNQAQNNIAGSYPLADGHDLIRPMVNPQERAIISSQIGKTSIEQTLGNQSHVIPGYGSVQGNENQSLNLTGSHMAPASETLQENSSNANKSGHVTQPLEKCVEESILQIPPTTQQQNNGLTSYTAVDSVQVNYDVHSAATLSSTSRLDMHTAPSQSNLPNFLTNAPMAAPEQGPETMTPPGLPPRSQPPRQPAPQGLVTPPKMFNTPGNVAGSSPLSPSIYLSGQAPRHRRTSWTDADMRPKGMLPPMHPRVMNPGILPYPQGHHVRQRLFNPNSPRGYGTGEATRGTRGRGRGRPANYSKPVDDDDVIVVGEQFRQRPPLQGRGVPLNYARGGGQTPPRFSKPITSNRVPNLRGAPPPKVFDISKHFEDLACVVNSTGEDEEVGKGDEDLQIVGVFLPNDKSSQPKAVDASQFSFCCVHCGKDQGSKNVMKQHMKVSHNDTLLGAFTNVDTGQLLFFCPQLTCEFMTYDESRLSEHLTKCYNLDSAKSVDFETAIKNLKSLKIRQLDVRSMGSHDNPIHLDGQGMKDNFSSSLNDAFDDIVVNTSGRHIAKQLTPKHSAPQIQRHLTQNPPYPRGPLPAAVPLRQQGYPGMRQKFPVGPYRMGRPNATVNRPTGLRNMRQHQPAMHPSYRHPAAANVHPGMGVRGMYPPRMRPQFVRAPPPPPPPHGQQASQAGGEQEPIVIDIDEEDYDSHRKGSVSDSPSLHGQYLHNGQMAGLSVPAGNNVPDAEQIINGNLTTGHNPEIAVRDNFLKEPNPANGKASQLSTMSQHNSNNNGRNSFQNQQGGNQVPIRDSVTNQHKFDRPATNLFDGSPVMLSSSQSFDQVDPTAALQMVVKSFPKLQLPNLGTESSNYYKLLKQNTATGDTSYPQRQNADSGSTNDSSGPYIVENNHYSSSLDDSVSESYPYEDSQSTFTESTVDQQNSQNPGSVSETVRAQEMLNTSTESAVVTEGNTSSSQGIATSIPSEYFNDEEKIYAVVLEKVFAKVPNMPKHLSHRLVSKFKEYLNYRGVEISSDSNVIDEFVSKISYKGSSADKMEAKSLPHPPVLSQSQGAMTSSPRPNEGDEPSDSAEAPDSHEPPLLAEPQRAADQTCNPVQPHDQSEDNPSSELYPSQNDSSEVITTQVILAERKIQFPGLFSKAPVDLTALNKRTAILACKDQQPESTSPSNASFLSAEDLKLKLVKEGIKDNLGESTDDENNQRGYVCDGDCKMANNELITSVDGWKHVSGNTSNNQDRFSGGDNALETPPVSQPSNLQESCDSNSLETHPGCQASDTQDHLTRDNNVHEITSEIEKLDTQETSSVKSLEQKDDKENTDKKFQLKQSKTPVRRFSASVIGERVRLCTVRRSGSFPINLSTVGQSLSETPSKNKELTSPNQVLPELASNVRSVSTPLSRELRMGLEVCIPSAPYFTQDCPTLSLKEVSYPSPSVSDKTPILITSSIDYLVSGHDDLEVDIAGKPDDSRLLHVGKFEPADHEFDHHAGIVSEGMDKSGAEQKKRKSRKKIIKGSESAVSSSLRTNNNVPKSPEKKIRQPKKRGSDLKSNIKSRFVDQKTGKLILKVSKRGRPRKLAESHEKVQRDSSDVKISTEVGEKISEEVKEKISVEVNEKILEEVKEKISEDDVGKQLTEEANVEKTTIEPSNELISELSVRRSDRKRKIIQSDYRSELADIDELLSNSDDEYKIEDDDSGSDCKWKTDSGHSNVLKKRVRKAKEPPDLTAFNTSTKGKFKCWLCKKTFLKCMGGKAHIIKKHKQGFCTIDMVQLEETNQLHLLLYCPRECKYATFSLDGLHNHLISCKMPLYKENGENWLEINTNFIDTLYPELLKTGVNDLLGASNAKPATKDPAKVAKRKKKKSTSEPVTSTSSVIISHGEAQVIVEPEDNVIKVLATSVEQTTSSIKAGVATQVTGSVTSNISCDTLASSAKSSSLNHIPVVSRPQLAPSLHQHKLNAHDVPLHPQLEPTQTASIVQAQFVQRKFSPLPHPRFAYRNAHTNNIRSQVVKSQQNNAKFVASSTLNNAPRFSQVLPVAPAVSSSLKQMPPSIQQQQLRFEQSRFPSRMHHPGFFDTSSPVNRQNNNPIPRPNHLVKEGNLNHKPILKVMGRQEASNVSHNPAVANQHDDKQSNKGQDSDIYMIEDNGTICIE